jgi:hypothetical protein
MWQHVLTLLTSHHHHGSLTKPEHVATLEAELKSVVLGGYCCSIYCDIEDGTSFWGVGV